MKFSFGLIALVSFSCLLKHSVQFQTGAPSAACETLLPSHRGTQPQETPSPYELFITRLLNGNYIVKIRAVDVPTFTGFLIQARRIDDHSPVGRFIIPAGAEVNYQTATCVSTADSATHTSATGKSELDIVWMPPVGFKGQIYFTGTVLREFFVFWGGIRSFNITIADDSDEIYGNCDGTRNCYGTSSDCVEYRNCDALAIVNKNDNVFQFELKTWPIAGANKPQYIAFGISNGRSMAQISVIECEVGENSEIGAFTSFTQITEAGRGAVRTDVPQNIIRLITSSYQNDAIHCVIERDTVSTVYGREFNLLTGEYHVHLAVGSALRDNQVGFHNLVLKSTEELAPVYYFEPSTDTIYDNCDGNTVCFGAPLGCIGLRNCEAVVVVHYTDEKFQIEMKTMVVSETSPPAYIAFGISDEPSMADISVVECAVEDFVIHGYISQTEITETSRNAPRTGISQDVVRLIQSTYTDGAIHCIIERDTVSTVSGRNYNLLDDQYYIHVAVGTALRENSIGFHNLNKETSLDKISLYQPPAELDPIYDGCGVTKGCFGHPPDCINTLDCLAVTTINYANNVFQFEMLADNRNAPRYVAFGLSKSTGMADASVIECVVENDAVKVYTSYTSVSPFGATRTNIPQNIVRLVEGTYLDGQIYCLIERDTVSEVRGQAFDLMKDEYHLLIASGTSVGENAIEEHDRGRLISASRQSLLDLTFDAASPNASIKVHGIFMIIAWVGTSTIGIILARYFKKTWVGRQIVGKDQWFICHISCMACTGLLTIVAFIVIFVEIDDWSAEDNPHAILGTIVTAICLLQTMGGIFRPGPDDKNRIYFNWGHMLGGSTAQILAVITIFFSVSLTKSELSDEFYWVMGSFCLFYIIMYTIFHILVIMGKKQTPEEGGEEPFKLLRQIMLGVLVVVTLLFVVALTVLIGIAPI